MDVLETWSANPVIKFTKDSMRFDDAQSCVVILDSSGATPISVMVTSASSVDFCSTVAPGGAEVVSVLPPEPVTGVIGIKGEKLSVLVGPVVELRQPDSGMLRADLSTAVIRGCGEAVFGIDPGVEIGFTLVLILLNRGSLIAMLSGDSVIEFAGEPATTRSRVGGLENRVLGAVAATGVVASARVGSRLGDAGQLLPFNLGED